LSSTGNSDGERTEDIEEEEDEEGDDGDEDENGQDDGILDDYEDDLDGEGLGDLDFFNANAEGMEMDTPFSKRQKVVSEQISEIEKEISGKRSWELSGEVKASERPQNSLLSTDMDVERFKFLF